MTAFEVTRADRIAALASLFRRAGGCPLCATAAAYSYVDLSSWHKPCSEGCKAIRRSATWRHRWR